MAKLLTSCSTKIAKKIIFNQQRLCQEKNFKVEYLGEFDAIFKNILGGCSRAEG